MESTVKTAIIGMGNMGTLLLEVFMQEKLIDPSYITIANRSKEKLIHLKKQFKQLHLAENNEDAIKNSELIFLCAKPKEIVAILNEHKHLITNEKCIVSITSPIEVESLEKLTNGHCVRMIPSITNRSKSGITLLTFSEHCSEKYKEFLWRLCRQFSTPIEIEEKFVRISSDIVSCGPAFLSFILQEMIAGAQKKTNIDRETATKLVEEMVFGVNQLIKDKHYSLQTLEEKVCVKGGITGEGLIVLEKKLTGVFEEVFDATHRKFAEEKIHLKEKFKLD